jgi:hypothetical protein
MRTGLVFFDTEVYPEVQECVSTVLGLPKRQYPEAYLPALLADPIIIAGKAPVHCQF